MLNLYVAPRSAKAPIPSVEAVDAMVDFLRTEGLAGQTTADGDLPPGPNVRALFHSDAQDSLLPAELTVDAFRLGGAPTPRFLPELQTAGGFDASCTVCGDGIDEEPLDQALARLGYFSVARFALLCPSCRTELTLRQVDFGQPTAIARWWLYIEGAATSRLNQAVLDRLERRLGLPLVVVPEVPEEQVEDWVPARRQLRRRR